MFVGATASKEEPLTTEDLNHILLGFAYYLPDNKDYYDTYPTRIEKVICNGETILEGNDKYSIDDEHFEGHYDVTTSTGYGSYTCEDLAYYDDDGRLSKTVVTYKYDADEHNYKGVTKYKYDEYDRVISYTFKITYPSSDTTYKYEYSVEYDGYGRLIGLTRSDDSGFSFMETTHAYDGKGHLITSIETTRLGDEYVGSYGYKYRFRKHHYSSFTEYGLPKEEEYEESYEDNSGNAVSDMGYTRNYEYTYAMIDRHLND